MCEMSEASEISQNVWLGPTPDTVTIQSSDSNRDKKQFDVYIEASDVAQLPLERSLSQLARTLEETNEPQYLEFPSSGSILSPTWSQAEADGILEMCRWIYDLANSQDRDSGFRQKDADGDSFMSCEGDCAASRRVLIHCTDGYTESSMLALAYFMYAECLSVPEAWVKLHCEKKRNFFAYPSDVALLSSMQMRLMSSSPRSAQRLKSCPEPAWLSRMDGSLPSRILPYMYLGNLPHANNPDLLRAVGITRILSVGEPVTWSTEERERWGSDHLMLVDRVQDNGVDPLTEEFDRCLEFIGKLRSSLGAVLKN